MRQTLELQEKEAKLGEILASFPDIIVAYSGGVDSTFLLKKAADLLADRALGAIGVSPSLPQSELKEALAIATRFSLPVTTLETAEMDDENYRKNPLNRCYFCKKELFGKVFDYARKHDFHIIADGTNADDAFDFRPGMKAARELEVRSPLKEAGLTKADIRELSREMGLPTWNKPEMACLASRIPSGTMINRELLHQVETAEAALRGLGFRQLRVRHHGELARIELAPKELPQMLKPEVRLLAEERLKAAGYQFVTVDLAGYRRGKRASQKNTT